MTKKTIEINLEFKKLLQEVAQARAKVGELVAQIEKHKDQISELEKSYNTISTKKLGTEIDTLKDKVKELSKELGISIAGVNVLKGRLNEIVADYGGVKRAVGSLKKEYAEVNKAIVIHNKRLQSAKTKKAYDDLAKSSKRYYEINRDIQELQKKDRITPQVYKAKSDAIKDITLATQKNKQVLHEYTEQELKELGIHKQVNDEYAKGKHAIDQHSKKLKQQAKDAKAAEESLKRMRTKIVNLKDKLSNLSQEDYWGKIGRKRRREVKALEKDVRKMERDLGDYRRSVGEYERGTSNIIRGSLALAGIYSAGDLFRRNIGIVRNFNLEIQTMGAISQATASEIEALNQYAQLLGRTTEFTASNVAKLETSLARLGFSPDQLQAMTRPVLEMATAMDANLAEASELAGATINAFGKDATDTQKVVDVLTKATTSSALSFEKLKTALPLASSSAKKFGASLETTTALLGILANNGVSAEISGTGLKNLFVDLASQGRTLQEALEQVHSSTNPLVVAFDKFGKRGVITAGVLSEMREQTRSLTDELSNSLLTAFEVQQARIDTLDGSIRLLISAYEGYILSLNDSSNASNYLSTAIQFLARNLEGVLSTVITLITAFVGYKAGLIAYNVVQTTSIALARAYEAITKKNIIAQRRLNATMKGSPWGLALSAVSALVTAYALFKDATDKVADAQKRLNEQLTESINKAQTSFVEGRKALNVATDPNAKVEDRMNAIRLLKEQYEGLFTVMKEVDNLLLGDIGEGLKTILNTDFDKKISDHEKEIDGLRYKINYQYLSAGDEWVYKYTKEERKQFKADIKEQEEIIFGLQKRRGALLKQNNEEEKKLEKLQSEGDAKERRKKNLDALKAQIAQAKEELKKLQINKKEAQNDGDRETERTLVDSIASKKIEISNLQKRFDTTEGKLQKQTINLKQQNAEAQANIEKATNKSRIATKSLKEELKALQSETNDANIDLQSLAQDFLTGQTSEKDKLLSLYDQILQKQIEIIEQTEGLTPQEKQNRIGKATDTRDNNVNTLTGDIISTAEGLTKLDDTSHQNDFSSRLQFLEQQKDIELTFLQNKHNVEQKLLGDNIRKKEKLEKEYLFRKAKLEQEYDKNRKKLQIQNFRFQLDSTANVLSGITGLLNDDFEGKKHLQAASTAIAGLSAGIQSFNNAGGYPLGIPSAIAMAGQTTTAIKNIYATSPKSQPSVDRPAGTSTFFGSSVPNIDNFKLDTPSQSQNIEEAVSKAVKEGLENTTLVVDQEETLAIIEETNTKRRNAQQI